MSSIARYQKAPADLSKGEIYQKLQAARRTQLRRRAESKDMQSGAVEGIASFASGVALGKGLSMFPAAAKIGPVDTIVAIGVAGTAMSLAGKGDLANYAGIVGKSALAIAGADYGRSL